MNPHHRTGFPLKFLDPFYRKLFLDRSVGEEEALEKTKDNTYPDRSPPEETEGEISIHKFEDLVEKTSQPLFKIKTAIPLDPFPNEIIIDINKVNIIFRYFFRSQHIHSIYIKDISDIIVETSLFFSTLSLVDVGFTENSIDINYLKTDEALKARRIIQGLIIAHKNGIDFSKTEIPNLRDSLEELGKAQ